MWYILIQEIVFQKITQDLNPAKECIIEAIFSCVEEIISVLQGGTSEAHSAQHYKGSFRVRSHKSATCFTALFSREFLTRNPHSDLGSNIMKHQPEHVMLDEEAVAGRFEYKVLHKRLGDIIVSL